jgi:hypothetical protein
MTTQCEQILKHLQTKGPLTPIDALNEYGCFRLASRILDLKSMGHDILSIRRQNGEKFYAEYVLRT